MFTSFVSSIKPVYQHFPTFWYDGECDQPPRMLYSAQAYIICEAIYKVHQGLTECAPITDCRRFPFHLYTSPLKVPAYVTSAEPKATHKILCNSPKTPHQTYNSYNKRSILTCSSKHSFLASKSVTTMSPEFDVSNTTGYNHTRCVWIKLNI